MRGVVSLETFALSQGTDIDIRGVHNLLVTSPRTTRVEIRHSGPISTKSDVEDD